MERGFTRDMKLVSQPGWYALLWAIILTEADDEGVLRGLEPDDWLAALRTAGLTHDEVEKALSYFERRGMVRRGARTEDSPATVVVLGWEKYQPKDPTAADRQRLARWRKEQGVTDRDVTRDVTHVRTDVRTDVRTNEELLASDAEKPAPPPGSPAALHASCVFCNHIKQVWPDVAKSATTLHVLWEKTYPYLDLMHEARKAYLYEQENPHKAKRDHRAYFGRWLRRAQDTHGGNAPAGSQVGLPPVRKLTEKEQAEREALRAQVKRTKEQLAEEAKSMSNQPRGELKTLTKALAGKMGDA